jgi:hypothetical protein
LLKSADRFLLEAFVAAVAAHRDARATRACSPLLLAPERGDRIARVSQLTGEIRRQARLIAELGSKLGLAPDARLRLADGTPGNDVTPEYLAKYGPLRVVKGGPD